MSRWAIRIIGIVVLLILFLTMFQMLNTLKRLAQKQGSMHGVRWPQPPLSYVTGTHEHTKAAAAAAALHVHYTC
jgi:hypothetical protein